MRVSKTMTPGRPSRNISINVSMSNVKPHTFLYISSKLSSKCDSTFPSKWPVNDVTGWVEFGGISFVASFVETPLCLYFVLKRPGTENKETFVLRLIVPLSLFLLFVCLGIIAFFQTNPRNERVSLYCIRFPSMTTAFQQPTHSSALI